MPVRIYNHLRLRRTIMNKLKGLIAKCPTCGKLFGTPMTSWHGRGIPTMNCSECLSVCNHTQSPKVRRTIMSKRKNILRDEEITPMRRASELAEAHWDYISDLLIEHRIANEEIERIGFHYRSAMIHGFKHGFDYALSIPPTLTPTI